MKIYAISDLHLSSNSDKPMDIFGEHWEGHFDEIVEDWKTKVEDNDVILLSGDLSWAMKLDEAKADLNLIGALPGRKVIIRGNHDYWWSSYSKVKDALMPNMYAIQNDVLRFDNVLICGTRGWTIPDSKTNATDKKIYDRELLRLRMSLEMMNKVRCDGDKVIGMIHFPPFNTNYLPTEFTRLFNDFQVDTVVYGHLHYSRTKHERLVNIDGVQYHLTSCDLVNNKLVEIANL